ncbi:class D beta-lactamase [Gracilibacillus dipsosauri]|uniref:Beta-lactamase n=1 Tax=Gracilibacillus dipsosauri TaxID=178340 RepID=A0A317L3G9_9BACI|nr:class D beta-lactamase [Gracilibacillus dipsosauri]PWU69438.1 class D beta-lactamase [Gracilibacillus dipsosauri]
MRKLRIGLVVLLTLLIVFTVGQMGADAKGNKEKELHGVEKLLNGKDGTIILKNLKKDKTYVYNQERSKEKFTPESTFKVPNALIGLQTSTVRDEYEVKRWDGTIREFEDWNRDHTLASGMRHSVIWYYQHMARDIGKKQMQSYMNLLDYGNQDISGGIDTFWLDSSLKITAREQIDFIEKLVKEQLPFAEKHQKTVKRMMIEDEQDEYTLHGKTGTRLSDLGLGWYIGFIKTTKEKWVFATNIDGTGSEAKNVILAVLKQKDIIRE